MPFRQFSLEFEGHNTEFALASLRSVVCLPNSRHARPRIKHHARLESSLRQPRRSPVAELRVPARDAFGRKIEKVPDGASMIATSEIGATADVTPSRLGGDP